MGDDTSVNGGHRVRTFGHNDRIGFLALACKVAQAPVWEQPVVRVEPVGCREQYVEPAPQVQILVGIIQQYHLYIGTSFEQLLNALYSVLANGNGDVRELAVDLHTLIAQVVGGAMVVTQYEAARATTIAA